MRPLKPGIVVDPKTKFNGKRFTIFLIFSTWVLSILACSLLNFSPGATNPTKSVGISTQIPDPVESETLEPDPQAVSTQTDITATAEPEVISPTGTAQTGTKIPPILYYTQAGDTLDVLAIRFGVQPTEISSPDSIPPAGLMQPNQLLIIPARLGETTPPDKLMPDSEIVYSPSAVDFDIKKYVQDAGGELSTYKQYLKDGWYTGAGVVQRVAIENSVNPRLLLALLEYQSHWVFGQPANLAETDYPMGYIDF